MKTRSLSPDEYLLTKWMLEHSCDDAQAFLPQLEQAKAKQWNCSCGCASFDFFIKSKAAPLGSKMRVLADFVFEIEGQIYGVFVFERCGILAGVEFYPMGTDASKCVPPPEILKPFEPK